MFRTCSKYLFLCIGVTFCLPSSGWQNLVHMGAEVNGRKESCLLYNCHSGNFDVSLTVHLSITFDNDQLDAQIFNTLITILYMFQAISCSSGRQIVSSLSDPTSDLVRQYDFSVPLRCRKTSDTVFVAFVRLLSKPVRCFFSCSRDFSQQITQVVLFLFLCVFLF